MVSWLGGNGRWINGAFWSTGTIPGPTDDVVISAAGTYAVIVDASVAAGSLTVSDAQATVVVQATNNVNTALFVNGVVQLQAGTLELLNGGVLTGATLEATGGTVFPAGGSFDRVTVRGTLSIGQFSANLYFADGLTFTGASGSGQGSLLLYGYNATLHALDNETLDNVAISSVSYTQFLAPASLAFGPRVSFADAGSVQITAANFSNAGAIDATKGSLSIYGNTRNTGIINTGTGGSFNTYGINFTNLGIFIDGSSYSQLASNASMSAVSSTGQVVVQAVPVNFVNGGTMTIAAHAALYVATQVYYYGGGTGGAYVSNSGLLTVDGDLELSLQNLLNTGTISIDAGGTLDANFLAASGSLPGASGTLTNSGVINLAQGGTFELGLNGPLTVASFGNLVSAGGTVLLTRGTLDDTGGTLAVGGVGTITNIALTGGALLHGGVVLAAPGATVSTQGTLDGVTWIGPLSLPASNGSYSLTLQNGFTLQPAAGAALGAFDAENGSGTITVAGATLTPAAINLDTTLVLTSDLTIDAVSVLNAASGRTLVTSATAGSTVGTLTLQGITYATAPNGSLGLGRPVLNNGTLVIGNGDVVSVGSLAGTGTVDLGVGELSIAAGASATETIRFTGPGATIGLTAPLLNGGAMQAQVQNFGTGDTIDLGSTNADQVFYEGGDLVFTRQGTLTATVPFSTIFSGNFVSADFQLVANKVGGVGVTTTVPGAAALVGPAIVAANVVATPTSTPFSALTITDPNPTELDSVTVTTTASGAFSNPGATGAIDKSTTYVAAGTAAALAAELNTLVFTETAGGLSVNPVAFTIDVSSPSGTSVLTQTATLVTQLLGYATVPPAGIAFATSPDGSSFVPPVAGLVNEGVVTAPAAGSIAVLQAGYQAEYLAGSTNATLVDPGYGNALLVANMGSDLLYANGNGDSLVGGSGGDTMVATGAATIQAMATSGNTVIIGGSGATSIRGPNSSGSSTILAGSGNTAIMTFGSTNTIVLGAGSETVTSFAADTIFAGTGAINVVATGGRTILALGAGAATVGMNGSVQTVFGGSGPSTVSLYSGDLMFGGSGSAVVIAQQSDTVFGLTGTMSVFGGGVFKGGSNGGNLLDLTANNIGGIAFGGGNGDLLISHGSGGGQVNQLVAGAGNVTLVADPGSANTAMFTGAGNDTVTAAGAHDTVFGSTGAVTVGTGSGAYAFSFTAGSSGGSMLINGFDPTQDRLVLTAYTPGTAANAVAGASVTNGSETLTLTDGTRITLVGFTGLTTASIIGG